MKPRLIAAALGLCLLLTSAAAQAEDIAIVGPTQIANQNPVFLRLTGVPTEHLEFVNWSVFPTRAGSQFVTFGREPLAFFWSTTPGTYTVIADVNIVPDTFLLLKHEIRYGVDEDDEEDEEEDEDEDEDEEDDDLRPTFDRLWGVVVVEGFDRDEYGPKVAQVLASTRLRNIKNFSWRVVDKDETDEHGNTPADVRRWVDRAERMEFSLPYLFLVDESGRSIQDLKLPETVDEVIDLVRRWLGK